MRDELAGLARSLRATPFVLLYSALQAVLHRWSGRAEFLVGCVAGNRPDPRLERIPGLFVNTVPLRCHVDAGWSFAELCRRSRPEAYRLLTHRTLPFDRLTAATAAARGDGQQALATVGFVYQNAPAPDATAEPRWHPPVLLGTGTAKFDLLFVLEDGPDGLTVTLEHDTDRYPHDIAHRIGAALTDLLASATGDPDRPLRDLPGAPPDGLALPEPPPAAPSAPRADAAPPAGSAASPLGPDERRAAELFTAALAASGHAAVPPADRLRPDANFFALGGHSLMAVTMLAGAQRDHGIAVAPRDFLADPTVAGLARLLAAARTPAPTTDTDPEPATTPPDRHPATPVQQRFWFLDRIPALRPAYLVPALIEYTGPIDRAALRRSLDTVLARHPALRSRFELDRRLRQVVYRTDGPPAAATLVDASDWDPDRLRDHLAALCQEGFDLATDAPVRAEVIAAGERTVLALVAQHIVVDGWSRRLLLEQVAETYRAEVEGDTPDLPDPVHPASATPALAGSTEEVVAALTGAPTDCPLPHDRPRGELQSTRADTRSVRLGPDLAARTRATVAGHQGCTTFMATAALLAVALARRGDQRDFLIAFPWAGRDAANSADAVGMFVNTLVLRVDLTGRPTWRDLLERVRRSSALCYRNADVPFDAVVADLHPDRDLSRPPLTPVYLSFWDGPPDLPPLRDQTGARYLRPDPAHIKYELELDVTEHGDDIELAASYATALFDGPTMAGLLDAMVAAARDLTSDPESHPL